MKRYVLNTGTGANYKYFDSKQEAYEFVVKHVNPRKLCEKERILGGEK